MPELEKYYLAKKNIAHSFAQAAVSYDDYADLQREVADKLLSSLNDINPPRRILDLGCGTGYCTDQLKVMFPAADIISLDIAEGMVTYAKSRSDVLGVCADAEFLPFVDNSFDLIVSSLAIQWCQNYRQLFSDLHRILQQNGTMVLSSFGPETLAELKLAWAKVDNFVHVNLFVKKDFLKKILLEEDYQGVKIQGDLVQRYYSSLKELSRELKAIGAHNMNSGQAQGLGSRKKIVRLKEEFEINFKPGLGIPVTYELFYLMMRKQA